MTKVYITRHGETEWNVLGKMQGRLDSPLTEKGRMQAGWLNEGIKDIHIDHMYSSSSGRAFETATIVRGNHTYPLTKVDDLMEMYLGIWEGRTFDANKESHPEQFDNFWHNPHLFEPHDCESYQDIIKRTVGFVENVVAKHEGETIFLVAHAIVLKSILNYYKGAELKDFWNSSFAHSASLTLIEFDKEGNARITLECDTSHYKEETN